MARIAEIEFDILVVGSGPSGIAAALYCLQRGKKTVLLGKVRSVDKLDTVRVESIHPGVISLLNHLNISSEFSKAILGTYYFINDGKNKKSINPFDKSLWEGFHISKQLFNDHLNNEAKIQNLVILDETVEDFICDSNRIKGVRTCSGKNILSKYVIDASGHQRILGKRMKFHEEFCSDSLIAWTGVTSNVECDFDDEQSAYFLPNKNGWTWIAKLGDNSFYWTRLSSKSHADISAPTELSGSMEQFKGNVFNTRWRIFRPLCIEGAISCGDAAFLIDPATGQGTFNALSSGMMAGRTAISCIDNEKNESFILAEYDNWNLKNFEQKATQLSHYYKDIGVDIINLKTSIF